MTEVEQILTDKKIRFIPKGKDLLVVCFNPEHDDSHPSMRIDRVDGRYHCFSCGHKGDIFFDFDKHKDIASQKARKLLDEITSLRNSAGISLPKDAFEFTRAFGDISAETVIKFEAFTSEKEFPDRLVFPIKSTTGSIVGLIGRYMNSNATPKYLVKPKDTPLPLFPPPAYIEQINSSVILVEGIRDMLNCYDKGMKNVICSFGTAQLSKETIKEKFLPYRLTGVQKVYIMFDGDDAGIKAAKSVESLLLYNTDFLTETIYLSEDTDPGELSQTDVDSIKKYLINN